MKTSVLFLYPSLLLCVACNEQHASPEAKSSYRFVSTQQEETISPETFKTMEYETLVDPNEGAFKLSLPKGWSNKIGVERVMNETRMCAVSVSPDEQTRIFFGDPSIPVFNKPIPEIGLYAGYNSGNPMSVVAPFTSAAEFYGEYVRNAFGYHESFKITSTTTDKDGEKRFREEMNKHGQGSEMLKAHTALITFEYVQNKESYKGILRGMSVEGPTTWNTDVSGFTTRTENFDEVMEVLFTITKSYEPNMQWRQRQQQMFAQQMQQLQQESNARLQQLASAHQQRMADMNRNWNAHQQRMQDLQSGYDQQNKTWNNQQQSLDNQHKRTVDAIREEQLIGTTNGQRAKVDAGYNYYYVNPYTKEYIGSQSEIQSPPQDYEQWNQMDYGND